MPLSAEGLLSFSQWCPGGLCTMGCCPSPLFLRSRSRECPPQTALLLMSGSYSAGTQAKTSTTSEPMAPFSQEIHGRHNEENNSCPCLRCKVKRKLGRQSAFRKQSFLFSKASIAHILATLFYSACLHIFKLLLS